MGVGLSVVNLANKWLDMLGGTAFSAPAAVYMKLHTGDPGVSGTANAAVGDATRKQVTWAAAASGSKAMSSMASNWTNGGTSETISHVTLWDASSGGNFLDSIAVTVPKPWGSTDQISVASLSIAFTPLAS